MKCVLLIYFALFVLSLSITLVTADKKEENVSRGDSQIFKNTSSQPPPPIPPDNVINNTEENITIKPDEEVEIITKEVTTIPLSTAIHVLDSTKLKNKSEKKNSTDEITIEGSDTTSAVGNESTSTTEAPPLIKISVTSTVSSSVDENNKIEYGKNDTEKVHRRPTPRVTEDKLTSSKPKRGNTILQRSGASGVCATPYGKMSVGQAIHWIGCRKIICRSERGFPHLLEKTCPPVPTNLPPGCTILHPSQTLPYPTCCPTPSCPPLGPRPPPTLTPASAKTRSKQTKKKPKASFFLSNGTPSVKIEENKGNVNVYEPEESSMKAPNASIAQESLVNEEGEITSTENESVVLMAQNSTNEKPSFTKNEKNNMEAEKFSNHRGRSLYNESKEAKTLLDMLVGRKLSTTTAKTASVVPDKNNHTALIESNRMKRINELLKNAAHHKNVRRKSHGNTSTRVISKFNDTKYELPSKDRADITSNEDGSKRYNDEIPWILNHTDPFGSDDEDRPELSFEMPDSADISEHITIIKASYNSDIQRKNDTDSNRKNCSSPIINAVSMTKVAVGDGYSNIEKSEHYEYSQETSIKNPFENTNLTSSSKQPEAIVGNNFVAQRESKKPKNATEIISSIEISSTTVPTTTVFSVPRKNFVVPQDQITESTSVEVSKKKESESKKNSNNRENRKDDKINQRVSIVETRPKYIKLFSMLKNSSGNKTALAKHNKFTQDTQVPNNLNKRDRITLAMVSDAIEMGLDELLNVPMKEKQPTTLISPNNGTDDLIEFIYIGLNPSRQISDRSNIRYLNAEEDMNSSETKQIERKRRNTKFQKQQENEIDKKFRSKSRPVFYIPWRQRRKEVENKNNVTEVPIEQNPSNISAQSSSIVESSTAQQVETSTKITNTKRNASTLFDANSADQPVTSEQIEVDSKPQKEENKQAELLAKRRSRSRMTIPGLRLNRNRTNNGTKLNEKLTAFTRVAHARYRKKNTNGDTATDKPKNATVEPKKNSASTTSRRRRFKSRRIQDDAKDRNDEKRPLPTATAPPKLDEKSQNNSRNRRMRTIRQRLLSRRKIVGKVNDRNETEEAADAKQTAETLPSSPDITEPPEVMKNNAKAVKASSDATSKESEKQTTTLPILSVNTVTNEKASSKTSEKADVATKSPKTVTRAKSLSARLRLKNRTGTNREPSPVPNYEKSTESPVIKLLSHEPAKIGLEDQSEHPKEESKAVGLTSESDQTLNAIDNEEKDELKEDRTNNRLISRRRQNLAQREKLLKLIRARARARKLVESTTAAETTTQVTTLKTISTLKPAVPTTSIPIIVPKKVELKRIPVKIIQEKPLIVHAPKSPQSIRQRLNPKPVRVTKPVKVKIPKRNPSPIRVTQPQPEIYSTTQAPTVTLTTTSAAHIVIPPRRIVQIDVRKPTVQRLSDLTPQNIQKTIVTPKASVRGQKTYNPPKINQIITHPQAAPVPVRQTHINLQQPTHPPNRNVLLITRTPQTQRPYFYQTFNSFAPASPNNQFNAQQNLQQVPVQNPHQNQQLHRTQQNIIHHPSQARPANPPQQHNQVVHSQVQLIPQTTTKKSVEYENLLPTIEDFPEMDDEYKIPSFSFEDDDFEYKEPQFVIDYREKNKQKNDKPEENKELSAPQEPEFTIPKEPTFTIPKKSKLKKENIPEGAKVTEDEYFIEGPSGVPIKVTTVTFHTSKSSVRNENVKNRSSHFKRDPFVDQ